MLSREQGHPLSLESPALPLTAPPSTGRAGRPKCAGRVCRRTEPSRRSVASRARLGQVTPARPAAPPSPGLRAPFRTPKAPALACGRSAPRARLRLDSGRARSIAGGLGSSRAAAELAVGFHIAAHSLSGQRPCAWELQASLKAQPSRLASPAQPQPSPRVPHRGAQRGFVGAK